MKKFILVMVFCLLPIPTYAIDFTESDKQLHIMGSALIVSAVDNYLLDRPASYRIGMALGAAALAGVAKECRDELAYGGFSGEDLVGDLVGSAIGLLISEAFHWDMSISKEGFKIKWKY